MRVVGRFVGARFGVRSPSAPFVGDKVVTLPAYLVASSTVCARSQLDARGRL